MSEQTDWLKTIPMYQLINAIEHHRNECRRASDQLRLSMAEFNRRAGISQVVDVQKNPMFGMTVGELITASGILLKTRRAE